VQGEKHEASRVIFMGWPGQHEMEDPDSAAATPDGAIGGINRLTLPQTAAAAAAATAQPLQALEERMRSQNGRQLGYETDPYAVARTPEHMCPAFAKRGQLGKVESQRVETLSICSNLEYLRRGRLCRGAGRMHTLCSRVFDALRISVNL
jgi:hypothetical protein